MKGFSLLILSVAVVVLVSGCAQITYDMAHRWVQKTFKVSEVVCVEGTIHIFIQNTGTEKIEKSEFTIKVDDTDASAGMESDIEVGETAEFSWDCGGVCSPGEHIINLKVATTEANARAICP